MVKQKQNSDTSYPALAKAARALLFVVALVALVPTFVAAVAWTHYSQSPRNIFCLLFVICPVVSISLTAIALRSPPYLRLRIAAFVAACALGAVASELLLSINAARAVELEPAARFVIRQRENGRSLHPYLAPTNFLRSDTGGTMRSRLSIDDKEILPVAGRSRSDLCPCNESGTPLVYRSDRFGMHNPDAVWDEAQLDIAVVGDSFAHGWCVPSESNFASHIRTLYPKTVNLGSAGHGPLLNLAAIREYLPSHKPK
ncbi:MAG: hypothetical protein AB8G99_18785, partial [Planctomycetaceae bacterium]